MTRRVPLAAAEAPPSLRWVTRGAPLLLVAAAFVPDPDAPGVHWVVAGLGLLTGVLLALAPRRLAYTLTAEGLVLQRLLGSTTLPYAGMRTRRSAGRLGLRTFGTALPGYLTGHFTFGPDALPRVQAAASRGTGGVIVEADRGAYFLTPADPDGFLRELAGRGAVVGA